MIVCRMLPHRTKFQGLARFSTSSPDTIIQGKNLMQIKCGSNASFLLQEQNQSVPQPHLETAVSMLPKALCYQPGTAVNGSYIVAMTKECQKCSAVRFLSEPQGMCCANGKYGLELFPLFHPDLHDLFYQGSPDSSNVLNNIRVYNCAYQFTSFGCNEVTLRGWNPQFRIQGQIIISLPITLRRETIFKRRYKIAISSDKRPAGEHARRFNAPESNEVALLMPNEPEGKRDIIMRNKSGSLHYNALQYPLLFPKGTNGWSFEYSKSRNNVSLMNYSNFH